MEKLFKGIDSSEIAHISTRVHGFGMAYITAPSRYYYDSCADLLTIGDDDSGIIINNFLRDYSVTYDEEYDDYTLKNGDNEVVLYF